MSGVTTHVRAAAAGNSRNAVSAGCNRKMPALMSSSLPYFADGSAPRSSFSRSLDGFDPRDVFGLEISSAFEDLERIFVVGEADCFRAPQAEHGNVARHLLPSLAVSVLPAKVEIRVAVAPLRAIVIVESRSAVVASTRGLGQISTSSTNSACSWM